MIPARLRPLAIRLDQMYRAGGPGELAFALYELIAFWRPVRTLRYRGFTLFYGRRTYIIARVRRGQIWEAPVADAVARELRRVASPVFVDAGANLGLMTLNVLAAVPASRVFAFEPGPRQARLLARTIAANRLEGRVTVYPVALGERAGSRPFAVHVTRYNALDGFLDTGRAPLEEIVTVEEDTLDRWWRASACPPVSVVKLDTEGAELWILRGAVDLLAQARPVVFLEIQPANLHAYPYEAADVFRWLADHDYGLETLDGTPLALADLERLMPVEENFVARPTPRPGRP